jgi:2'-5' RNA ligase
MRLMERLGAEDPRAAVVMQFASTDLTVRWRDFREDGGCSWDFEDYQPHITIAWDKDQVIDVSKLKPWTGELVFGPEVWEEVDEDWKAKTGIDE